MRHTLLANLLRLSVWEIVRIAVAYITLLALRMFPRIHVPTQKCSSTVGINALCVAQHKHEGAAVAAGPWAGHRVSKIFGDAVEALGEHCSTGLLVAIAHASCAPYLILVLRLRLTVQVWVRVRYPWDHRAICSTCRPEHAMAFLRAVRKSARLGGERSIAMHTTMAKYYSGVLLHEILEYKSLLKAQERQIQMDAESGASSFCVRREETDLVHAENDEESGGDNCNPCASRCASLHIYVRAVRNPIHKIVPAAAVPI